ncbi:MAG: hypothetical protein RMM28_10280 [Thermoleophilia bacterium]|nr:hypothetical protein [Gaiellaceae bacterium]MDW8339512.1 hypothetical protein [Thermoleophilia bacterium]
MSVYMEGSRIGVQAEFRVPDDQGPLTDPTTVTFTARRRFQGVLQAPTSYVYGTDPEVTRPSTGTYKLTFTPAEGTWYVHVQGTGAAHAAAETSFVIEHAEALV